MIEGLFIDRDGTINVECADYVKSWDEFALLPGVLGALKRLTALCVPIVVVTNQSAIGRGLVSRATIDLIHRRMQRTIEDAGGRIDAIYICPHRPEDNCLCRKPKPGLLLQAAGDLGLDLARCVMIGDTPTDYAAAIGAGCTPILVRTGRQGAFLSSLVPENPCGPIFADLSAAADFVVTGFATEAY